MDTLDLILEIARIPSFSSYEERLHPFIEAYLEEIPGADLEIISENNILIEIPGRRNIAPIALTAHLDKINHFGRDITEQLPVRKTTTKLIGQMDDSVGLGICLSILKKSESANFPPMYLLFSEMEESTGLKENPSLLKNGGKNLHSGIGAERLSEYLLKAQLVPYQIITIDTSPLFKGEPGVALYSEHWEKNGLTPSEELKEMTEKVKEAFRDVYEKVHFSNNTNDYLTYGKYFNQNSVRPLVSVALEPSIFPYHQKDEEVFIDDIKRTEDILCEYLETFSHE